MRLKKLNDKWCLITWVNRSELDRRMDGGTTFFFRYLKNLKEEVSGIETFDGRQLLTENMKPI